MLGLVVVAALLISASVASAGNPFESGFRRPIKLEGRLIEKNGALFLDQVKPDDVGVYSVVAPIRYRLAGDVSKLRDVKLGTTVKLWGRVYSDIIVATRLVKGTIPPTQ
jgi:hypothetical protein